MLRKFEVPCAPVLSMKEIANDPALRASGTVVEVQQEKRGSYLTVAADQVLRLHAQDTTEPRCWASTPPKC